MSFDHLLLIGFGGPESLEDVRPFLERVAEGRAIPEARLQEVEHHYEVIGGFSPYNKYAFQLKELLETHLGRRGLSLPVFLGMRNSKPFLKDTIGEIQSRGLKNGLGLILSIQRSPASCFRYKENVAAALRDCPAHEITYDYLPGWHAHPGFIEAQSAQVREALSAASLTVQDASVIFTVHSIPLEMARSCKLCDYQKEFAETAELIAGNLGLKNWELAYQSRSGNPRQPWLEPDILETLKRVASGDRKNVVVVPVGFLFDNAEILFDLDVEARELAESLGLNFIRAATVMGRPEVPEFFTDLIGKKVNVR